MCLGCQQFQVVNKFINVFVWVGGDNGGGNVYCVFGKKKRKIYMVTYNSPSLSWTHYIPTLVMVLF